MKGNQSESSPVELMARAKELAPRLSQRASAADTLRRIPDESIEELQQSGLLAMLQPTWAGGAEASVRSFFEAQILLSSACPSTGWVFGVLAVHAWQLALFPREAQEEVWGADHRALISSSYAPTGKVERVKGGYEVSGRWSFSSGSDHCGWAFLGGFAPTQPGDADGPDMRTFLLPRRDYRIEDNWYVSGLKATGSKDIVVDKAFVPEHRTHRFRDGFLQRSPGQELNTAPLYKLPFGQLFVRSVSTPALGAAIGALQVFREQAKNRIAASDGSKVVEEPAVQNVLAYAQVAVDVAQSRLFAGFAQMQGCVDRNEKIPMDQRVMYRFESAKMVSDLVEVVDSLFTASGGRAVFSTHPINRYFQDIHAVRAHYANNPDKPSRNFGRVLFGEKTQDFFV